MRKLNLLRIRLNLYPRHHHALAQAAAFEQRWAERKSSLAKLDGFRFFTLLRRVDKVGERTIEYPADTPDYMSMTVRSRVEFWAARRWSAPRTPPSTCL